MDFVQRMNDCTVFAQHEFDMASTCNSPHALALACS